MNESLRVIVYLAMIAAHIFADYNLQGILATMKQKSEWLKYDGHDDNMNKYDYKAALFAHSFMWTFVIFIPIIISNYLTNSGYYVNLCLFAIIFASNVIIHYETDDAKANKHIISLITDQIIHMIQISATYLIGINF